MLAARFQKLLFITLSLALGVIVFYKAATLSFTHDESGTYLFFHDKSWPELFLSQYVWVSANNHILNTILFQISSRLFGVSELSLRLPNALAYVGTAIVCFWFMFKYLHSFWARVLLFSILLVNPFTLEYFSLCRGYGLSMFFHFSGLCLLYAYISEPKNKTLYAAFFMLMLGSLSLLTNLILLPIYTLALWIWAYQNNAFSFKKNIHLFIAPGAFSLLSLALWARPVYFLSLNKEFKYGAQSLWTSLNNALANSMHYQSHKDQTIIYIFSAVFIALLLAALVYSFAKKKSAFFGYGVIILVLFLYAVYFMLDIYFPTDRKTTMYFPLLALFFATLIGRASSGILKIAAGILVGLLAYNFVEQVQLHATWEWYYDQKTKENIATLGAQKHKNFKLKTHWHLHPTATFYIQTKNYNNIELIAYNKDFQITQNPNVVLTYKDDMKNYTQYRGEETNEPITLFYKTNN